MKSSWPRDAQRPQLLFAVGKAEVPGHTLLGLTALARKLNAEVRVLQVLPRWFPGVCRSAAKLQAAERALRRSLFARMGESLGDVAVREGQFAAEVTAEVARRPVKLIVLSPRARRSGRSVTALATAAGTPVLALRGSSQRKAVLAATDFRQPSLPVLGQAAELCRHLGGTLVAFHHLDHRAGATRSQAKPAPRDVCQAALVLAASALPVPSTPVVRSDTNVVGAILNEAHELDVGLIVVGAYDRPWWQRWLHGSVAARVVSRARRSVLVTPLRELAPAQ